MRRTRLHSTRPSRRGIAGVLAIAAAVVLGRPLMAGGHPADVALTRPVVALQSPSPPAPPPPPTTTTVPPAPDPLAWFVPGGRNEGTEGPATALAAIALEGNEPLYLSDGWGRSTGSSTSDHYVGNADAWAVDLAVRGIQRPTPQTEEAARRVATALGVPDWAGGDLRVTIGGYRFQVLWKVAGHFNHVHVGVKKL